MNTNLDASKWVNPQNGTTTKWVTNVVLAAIIAALGFYMVLDRNRMQKDIDDSLKRSISNERNVAVMAATLLVIDKKLDRIEDNQARLLKAVR